MSITVLLLLFPIHLFRQVLCNILPVARIPFGFSTRFWCLLTAA